MGDKKKKSALSAFEDTIRGFTSKIAKPRTGEGSTSGRKQGDGEARFDNSGAFRKKKRK